MIRRTIIGGAQRSQVNFGSTVRCRNATACPEQDTRANDTDILSEWKTVRPYEQIPGPRPFPIVGNLFRFFPGIGKYGGLSTEALLRELRKTFGDIVKLTGLPNRRPCVFLFNPELFERMFRKEGSRPLRIAMETLNRYYSSKGDDHFRNSGLSTSQGEKWHRFRSNVNKVMMLPRTVQQHVSQIDEVASDFIFRIRKLRDPRTFELPDTFNNELNKWSLETIFVIALNNRLGCFETDLPPDSDGQTMINAVHEMFRLFNKLELQPSLWKLYDTPDLKKFFAALDTINLLADKHVTAAIDRRRHRPDADKKSVLERILDIDALTARTMALDMMIAGIDTTSNTVGKVLYMIASHEKVQEKVQAEVDAALPEKESPFTYETLNKIPYIKACIKESLRISPIASGTLRTMHEDNIIGGYVLPKGVDVVAAHSITSLDEEQFPLPDEFIPERWMRNNTEIRPGKDAHPFAYMPFGFGPRTCIGRRFAEAEMEVFVTKAFRNFRFEWHHEPMQVVSHFINVIGSPLQFKIIDR